MKLDNLFEDVGLRQLDEAYFMDLTESDEMYELAEIAGRHGALTGNTNRDREYLPALLNYLVETYQTGIMEADEGAGFDPFGWTKDWEEDVPKEKKPRFKKEKLDIDKDCILTFGTGNTKVQGINAITFSLPAGYACPFARDCLAYTHKHAHKGGRFGDTGKAIKKVGQWGCFATDAEVRPAVSNVRWSNFGLLRKHKGDVKGMRNLILKSLNYFERTVSPVKAIRIHDSGDFFSQEYFDAWLGVTQARHEIIFYAYTKSLPYWQARKEEIPPNFRLIASKGGKADELIDQEGFRQAIVVHTEDEAKRMGLDIDMKDLNAIIGDKDFALLLHGMQSKESGLGSQSFKNSKIIKNMASKVKIPPRKLEKAIQFYLDKAKEAKAQHGDGNIGGIPVRRG